MIEMIKHNKVVIVAIVIIIAGAIWYGASGGGATTDQALNSTGGDEIRSAQERAALDTLLQLRSIQLTGSIFTNPAFQSLRDSRTELVAEPVGRRNPFAPLTSTGTTTRTTSQPKNQTSGGAQ